MQVTAKSKADVIEATGLEENNLDVMQVGEKLWAAKPKKQVQEILGLLKKQ